MHVISCLTVALLTILEVNSTLYHVSSCPMLRLKNGRVRVRHRGKFARFFCNSGFNLAGERYSTCQNGVWDAPIPKCVRPSCLLNPHAPSNGLIYPTHSGAVLNFYCKSGYTLVGPTATYCDGRKWDNNLPACLQNGTKPKTFCDFESEDLCGWSHDLNHDFDWRRENFRTPSGSIGTGPSYDHTKGAMQDGYYMYIESSSRFENDTARLISPVFEKNPSDDVCFEFYYHMYGTTTGMLRVYLKKVSESWEILRNVVFEKSGNQGDKWYRGYVNLGPIYDDYQIVVEGVRGPGYISDIAIDDVKIIEHCLFVEATTEMQFSYSPETEQSLATVESCENRCGNKATGNETSLITCDCDYDCYDNNRCCPDYLDMCLVTGEIIESTTELSNDIALVDDNKESTTSELATTEKPLISTAATATTTVKITTNSQPPTIRISTTAEKAAETAGKHAETAEKPAETTSNPVKVTPNPVANATPSKKPIQRPKIKTPLVIRTPPTTPLIVRKVLTTTTARTPTKKTEKPQTKPAKPEENEVFKKKKLPPALKEDEISKMDYEDYEEFLDYPAATNFRKKTKITLVSTVEDHRMATTTILLICGGLLVSTIVLSLFFVKLYRSRRLRRGSGASRSQSDVRFLAEDEILDFSVDRGDEL